MAGDKLLIVYGKRVKDLKSKDIFEATKQISKIFVRNNGIIVYLYEDGTFDDANEKLLKDCTVVDFGIVGDLTVVLLRSKKGKYVLWNGEKQINLQEQTSLIASEINAKGSVTIVWSDYSIQKIDTITNAQYSIQLRQDLFDSNSRVLVNSNKETIICGSMKGIQTAFIFDSNLKSLLKRFELRRDFVPIQLDLIDNSLFIAYKDAIKREDLELPAMSLATALQNRSATKEISRPTLQLAPKVVSFSSVSEFKKSWSSETKESEWGTDEKSLTQLLTQIEEGEITRFATHCAKYNNRSLFEKVLKSHQVKQNEQIFEYALLDQDPNLLYHLVDGISDLTESQIITSLRFVLLRLPEYTNLDFVFSQLLPAILNYVNVNELLLLREVTEMTNAEVNALLKYLSNNQDKISPPNFAMWVKLILDGHFKSLLLSQPIAVKSLQHLRESLKQRLHGYNDLSTLLGQTKVLIERQKLPSKKDASGLQYTITVFQ